MEVKKKGDKGINNKYDHGQIFDNKIQELLTLDDLSKLLKVPKKTIYGWIHRRKIIPFRLGPKLIRFERSYIDRWISSQKGESDGNY